MLPATFDDDPKRRVSKSLIGVFAVAILAAGFSLTGLLTFAIRNPIFQADALFLPSLASCFFGLLTIFYDFLTSSRYVWNTPALLLVIAAALSTLVYGALLIYTRRRISVVRRRSAAMPLHNDRNHLTATATNTSSLVSTNNASGAYWQDPAYYENYVQNMFPASTHQQVPPNDNNNNNYDPNAITEEEMQRQQMLMLLLQKRPLQTPDPTSSTFRIDWQGQEQDDSPPANGWYAPGMGSHTAAAPSSAGDPLTGIPRQWTAGPALRPWDGVWRALAPAGRRGRASVQEWGGRETSRETREERRREIEMGR